MASLQIIAPMRRLVGKQLDLANKISWSTGSFAITQILRLVTSVVLAWILAPELLGTMLLINTLRTGCELLTDVGIGQSIVNNRRGEDPNFFNTAWTIQIIRGPILFATALVATIPLAQIYDGAEMGTLLPVAAMIFLITGFTSPSRFLLQKRLELKKSAIYNVGNGIFSTVIHIGLALYSPTIWALIGGLLLSAAFATITSFFLIDYRMHALRLDREAVGQIFHFGKWIFLNSLVFFAAMNFDRLYLADAIPLALLGVYGIARTFSDTATSLFQRVSSTIIFPKISYTDLRGHELGNAIRSLRLAMIVFVSVALACGIAIADEFIELAYDDRYKDAAIFLPVMLVGAWFAIFSSVSEAMMMGIGKPSTMTLANFLKIVMIALTVPLVLLNYGLLAAVMMFVASDAFRYLVLSFSMRRQRLSFLRQDLFGLAILIVLVLLVRELTGLIGLTGGIEGWLAEGGRLFGR